MSHPLRGSTAIVGASTAGLGACPGHTEMDIIVTAAHQALADAGLKITDVDGLFSCSTVYSLATLSIGEYLGIKPKFSDSNQIGGSSFVGHMLTAAMAIQNGLCETALIVYGSNQRSAAGKLVGLPEPDFYEAPYEPKQPPSSYAMVAARHMHEFGTTREQLAQVAVDARQWARMNPEAFMRDELSIEDVLNARMVSDPLTVRDCCLVTDGGGAIVMVSADRAKDFPHKPAYVLGVGMAHWHRNISAMPDYTVSAASESGPRAFDMAGLTPSDVDVLELYDAFTINTIMFLEDLGFCKKGEGGPFVADGHIGPGGSTPVNTNGGGLSCCHPGMYGIFTIVEAVRQLRGQCAERQIEGAEIALSHGNGGRFSSQVTALLGSEATL